MSRADEELRTAFDERRAADAASAPAFERMWARANASAAEPAEHGARPRWWIAGAAAAALVLAAFGVGAYRRARAPSDAQLAASVSRMMRAAAPTDGLLRLSRGTVATPGLLTSVLDDAAAGAKHSIPSNGDCS